MSTDDTPLVTRRAGHSINTTEVLVRADELFSNGPGTLKAVNAAGLESLEADFPEPDLYTCDNCGNDTHGEAAEIPCTEDEGHVVIVPPLAWLRNLNVEMDPENQAMRLRVTTDNGIVELTVSDPRKPSPEQEPELTVTLSAYDDNGQTLPGFLTEEPRPPRSPMRAWKIG